MFSVAHVKKTENDFKLSGNKILQTQTVLSIDGAVVSVKAICDLSKGYMSVEVGFS